MDTNILNKQLYDDIIKSHTSETYLTLENIGILYSQSYYPIKRVVFTARLSHVILKKHL